MNEVNAGRPTKTEKRFTIKNDRRRNGNDQKNKGRQEEGKQKKARLQKGWGVYSCHGRKKK